MGAHLSAYTSREHTAYYMKTLAKDLPKGEKTQLALKCAEQTIVGISSCFVSNFLDCVCVCHIS